MAKNIWKLDPAHSEIGFNVRHMMITRVHGVFSSFDVQMETEGDDLTTAAIQFSAQTESVNTGSEQRDAHLKSADFFDSANHPAILFNAARLEKKDESQFLLHGDLTIRGIKRPVVLNVEFGGIGKDPWGNTKAGFSLYGSLSRKDWNLTWNAPLEAGGMLVSEEVKLQGEIQLTKA